MESALRACGAKVGAPTVVLSTDDYKGSIGCDLQVYTLEHRGRRWVVFGSRLRDGNTVEALSDVVEMTTAGPRPYFTAGIGGENGPCGDAPPSAKTKPAGWDALGKEAQRFLCVGPG